MDMFWVAPFVSADCKSGNPIKIGVIWSNRSKGKLEPEGFGNILKNAIDRIDNGCVESVDALVRKAL